MGKNGKHLTTTDCTSMCETLTCIGLLNGFSGFGLFFGLSLGLSLAIPIGVSIIISELILRQPRRRQRLEPRATTACVTEAKG